MSKIYTSADQLIGKTPLMELTHIEKEHGLKAKILAKLEYFNPAGSVKDRVAKAMIDEAEKSGKLKKDSVIIEPTSGNTGIGLAAVAAARGYRIIIVMPETMSVERRQIMKAYGAELVLSDGRIGKRTSEQLYPGSVCKPGESTGSSGHDGPGDLRRYRCEGRYLCGGSRNRRYPDRSRRISEIEKERRGDRGC